ncbi:DUF2127 domain-containing protein [Acidovorax sp. CF316]|uniref:DUF2127 domain-containing protein n=1 Tax=Acidovorax sp. CF316 TaxID=1144317 RepID=UPI0002F0AF02|nr:DUF2127 domain-containing protein [Acidovorax sp. CF316]
MHPPTPGDVPPPHRQALRAIAAFEALKGFAALAASLGFVGLLPHDLHHIVASLIGHIGLAPGDRYPAMVLTDIDHLMGTNLKPLLLAAAAYVLVRFAEAYGLWQDRWWGEWLGALSGALYIPFELWHFAHRPSVASAAVALANMAIVGFLGQQLWRRRRQSP